MSEANGERLLVGQVARRAGVNVETLRYYERRGLLRQPPRRPSGYREYTSEDALRVGFIKRAQKLGFTLREIEQLLRLRDDRRASCDVVRSAAQAKVEDIDQKIASLKAMRRALETLVSSCESNRSARECPILEALGGVGT